MSFNSIETAAVFQNNLDTYMMETSTTGWMEETARSLIRYDGGAEIKIPNIVMDGLGNYDRDEGFKRGKVTLKYSTYKLTQDRGRSFMLDSMDVDETNFMASAGTVLGEFQRTQVIPEVDVYRYSKIAKKAIENEKASFGYTADESTIFKKLMDDIVRIKEDIGDAEELVITMPITVSNIFFSSDKIKNIVDVSQKNTGDISTTIKTINGIPIITVPTSRMKTAYKFNSGADNETAGGYEIDSTAKNINWIIVAKKSVLAVSKVDKPRIFTPEENVLADAWKIDYRLYHDIWIPQNKLNGIRINIKEAK